jgi:predicted nucleic acid-binding protein
MIVLDTTVLVYAVGIDHEFRAPCRDLLAAVSEGRIEATTTAQVIQECAYVLARQRTREVAADLAADAARFLTPLLLTTEDDVIDGLALWRRHDGLGSFDAVLAATAVRAGMTLVSADRALGRVRGLSHVVPTADAVRALLDDDAPR